MSRQCRHGTDLDYNDCMDCDNEGEQIYEAASEIQNVCMNCNNGEAPKIEDILPVLRALVDELLEND